MAKFHKGNVSLVYNNGVKNLSYIEKTLDDCLLALIKDLSS